MSGGVRGDTRDLLIWVGLLLEELLKRTAKPGAPHPLPPRPPLPPQVP